MLIQDLVDGLLLVVRSRMTPRAAIHDALGRVRADKVIGVVLNDQREYRDSYMTYAYHGYDMDTKPKAGSATPSARSSDDEDRHS